MIFNGWKIESALKVGVTLPQFLIKGLKIAGDLIDNIANTTLPNNDNLFEKK